MKSQNNLMGNWKIITKEKLVKKGGGGYRSA